MNVSLQMIARNDRNYANQRDKMFELCSSSSKPSFSKEIGELHRMDRLIERTCKKNDIPNLQDLFRIMKCQNKMLRYLWVDFQKKNRIVEL
jgi:hypothetical protein